MDMHDPSLTPASEENKDQNPTEAPANAADAVAPATSTDVHADPEAEAEAEELMSESELDAADTEESVLEAATALLEKDASEINADEIRRLRQLFATVHNTPSTDETESDQAPAQSETQILFEQTIEKLRAKKAAHLAQLETQRAENLTRKNDIIAQIIALADDTDNVNRTFPRYRELQDEFNAVGDVDPSEETGVWKRFQEAREKYSDNLKINKELRDYDFKKNLEEKEALLAEARALDADEDIIGAYRRLQDLHNKWRQIGPVAKELRDEIWNNFRDASAQVNKRYQAFFEARKAREAQNEAAKTELCAAAEAIDPESLKSFAAWDQATNQIKEIQDKWRTLGFASKKMNRVLFARFRATCDTFFAAKAAYFRNTRDELNNNLAAKQALVQQAEALKESTDWRAATETFVELQKKWKTIGAIPKRYSDDLWKQFTAACDLFFERKKKAGSGARQTEAANMRAKREIIGRLSALVTDETAKDDAIAALRKMQEEWKQIGHVPYKEKDKLYEAYRSAIDAVRNHFDIAESKARRQRFEASVARIEGDDDKIFREREKLVRALENRRNDLRTYENNLGFLSAKSRSGDSLLRDLERRIERLKTDISELEEKISLLDSKLG